MYCFIVNPNARSELGEKNWKRLECFVQKSGVDYAVFAASQAGDARRIAAELTRGSDRPQVLVAVGPDSALNEVADGISLESPIALAYIPGNADSYLARILHLPKSRRRALKRVLFPTACRYLDYGILSYDADQPVYRRFMAHSGIGLNALLMEGFRECAGIKRAGLRRRPLWLEKWLYGIRQILLMKPAGGYLLLDGSQKIEFGRIYFVSANIRKGRPGRWFLPVKQEPAQGGMDICVAHYASKLGLLPILSDMVRGVKKRRRGLRYYHCREAVVCTDRPLPVHVDGQCLPPQQRIQLRCVEKKLRMIC